MPPCWYHARVRLIAPVGHTDRLRAKLSDAPAEVTIGTAYPGLLSRSIRVASTLRIFRIAGAIEGLPGRVCDAAVDCAETGGTVRDNGATVVRVLLSCHVRLVASQSANLDCDIARAIPGAGATNAVNPTCRYAAPIIDGTPFPQDRGAEFGENTVKASNLRMRQRGFSYSRGEESQQRHGR
jgi:ATP phosphoribosyltransferase